MQLLLRLSFFSILLTAGSSLMCEHCLSATSDTCSGPKKECPYNNAVCMTLKTETSVLVKITTITKSCSQKDACEQLQGMKGSILPSKLPNVSDLNVFPSFQVGAGIKEVTCTKGSAPPRFASFFPAFLGLLLMKLLF